MQLRGVQTTTQSHNNKTYDEIIEIKDITLENDLINKKTDLMSINIEGGEYELLERMLKLNITKNIINIQIQFHEWYPSYDQSIALWTSIQKQLSITRELSYCYPFVWENWELKNHLDNG